MLDKCIYNDNDHILLLLHGNSVTHFFSLRIILKSEWGQNENHRFDRYKHQTWQAIVHVQQEWAKQSEKKREKLKTERESANAISNIFMIIMSIIL